MTQGIEAVVRFLITSQINLLAMSPAVGVVIFDILLLHFATTTAQRQNQLLLWAFAATMAVVAVLQIIGGKQ